MAKIAPYNNIACAITSDRAVDMKAFHKNILKKERWVDVRKFVSKGKRELSNGLFEIFGNYSDEPPHTVHAIIYSDGYMITLGKLRHGSALL